MLRLFFSPNLSTCSLKSPNVAFIFLPNRSLLNRRIGATSKILQGQKYIRRRWQKHLQNTLELNCSYLIAIHFWVVYLPKKLSCSKMDLMLRNPATSLNKVLQPQTRRGAWIHQLVNQIHLIPQMHLLHTALSLNLSWKLIMFHLPLGQLKVVCLN